MGSRSGSPYPWLRIVWNILRGQEQSTTVLVTIRVGVPGLRPRVEGVCRCMWEPGSLERSGGAGEWRVEWEGEDLGRHLAGERRQRL